MATQLVDLQWTGVGTQRIALACAIASAVVVAGLVGQVRPVAESPPAAAFEQRVGRALDQSTPEAPGRLVGMHLSAWGDLRLEFVVRDAASAADGRAAALADVRRLGEAVYGQPTPGLVNLTVLGLARGSSSPVVYASLPADRSAGLDWTRLTDVTPLGSVRWLPNGVCAAWKECATAT